ncbi:MAG: uncharacterized protein JWN86_4375 [Planctomycetota bacterium]|nr:uncharacterized protein [Planctomycetota bacterium]
MSTGVASETSLTSSNSPTLDIRVQPSQNGAQISSAEFRRHFTVADFEKLHELGFIDEDEQRFELLDGDLVPMSRPLPPHTSCVNRLTRLFGKLGDRASVVIQNPIFLGDMTQPQPDITLARLQEDGYELGHPQPKDIFLAVEVMDSSHYKDRGYKLPLYARMNIRETWLVDLPGGMLEVYRKPLNGLYTESLILLRGHKISPEAFPDLVLAVSSVLSRVES